jgi:hypothetical protein
MTHLNDQNMPCEKVFVWKFFFGLLFFSHRPANFVEHIEMQFLVKSQNCLALFSRDTLDDRHRCNFENLKNSNLLCIVITEISTRILSAPSIYSHSIEEKKLHLTMRLHSKNYDWYEKFVRPQCIRWIVSSAYMIL